MKTIMSTLLALGMITGIAGSASAASDFNAKTFFEQIEKNSG